MSLVKNLELLALPKPAIDWLLMLWDAIQVFDDVADSDPVDRKDLDKTIWNTLVAMGQNPFFQANSSALSPLVASMVLKWQASDLVEREGKADEKSFVWRAGYYEVVLMAVQIVHGPETAIRVAPEVLGLYGENFTDYKQEFHRA